MLNELRGSQPALPRVGQESDDASSLTQVWADAWDRLGEANQLMRTVSHRIHSQYPNASVVLEDLYGMDLYFDADSIWLTDRPERIYPQQIVYHVGSSRALEELCEGKSLFPPAAHWKHLINTQKGMGLVLVSILLEAAAEDPRGKDSALLFSSFLI